jgi:hypothetical protein
MSKKRTSDTARELADALIDMMLLFSKKSEYHKKFLYSFNKRIEERKKELGIKDSIRDTNNNVDIKYLGIPNICFSLTDADDDREKLFSKQRKERGFDSSELWSFFNTITDFILPRLKVFKENTCGHPGSLEDEKDWRDILDKMIKSFEISKEKDGMMSNKEYKEWKKGMNLFVNWYFALWY